MSTKPLAVEVYSPRALAVQTARPGVVAVRNTLPPLVPAATCYSLADVNEPALATTAATTSPLAVAAAVCALLGFIHSSGFVAGVLLGHVSLLQIKRSKGRLRGRLVTRLALTVSWAPFVLAAAVAALMFLIGLQTTLNAG